MFCGFCKVSYGDDYGWILELNNLDGKFIACYGAPDLIGRKSNVAYGKGGSEEETFKVEAG